LLASPYVPDQFGDTHQAPRSDAQRKKVAGTVGHAWRTAFLRLAYKLRDMPTKVRVLTER